MKCRSLHGTLCLVLFVSPIAAFVPTAFRLTTPTSHHVATTDITDSPADMNKVIGGRIEEALQSAKDRGEAAFVSFMTAGYPTAQGS